MTAYGTPTGVVGKVVYGSGENGKLLGIANRNDHQVLWFDLDGEGRISDGAGSCQPRVEYGYSGGFLTSVRDVLGNLFHL